MGVEALPSSTLGVPCAAFPTELVFASTGLQYTFQSFVILLSYLYVCLYVSLSVDKFSVNVEYLSREQWNDVKEAERLKCKEKLTKTDVKEDTTDFPKLYPNVTAEQIMKQGEQDYVHKRLDSSENLSFDSPEAVQKFIASLYIPDSTSQVAMWPLIKHVQVKGPFQFLPPMISMVDLPGFNDLSSKELAEAPLRAFLQRCDAVWHCFEVTRFFLFFPL
jgi:hypothetical protein